MDLLQPFGAGPDIELGGGEVVDDRLGGSVLAQVDGFYVVGTLRALLDAHV